MFLVVPLPESFRFFRKKGGMTVAMPPLKGTFPVLQLPLRSFKAYQRPTSITRTTPSPLA